MANVIQDDQGLAPGLHGPGQLAGGMVAVTEVGESHRLRREVAELASDAERAVVARGGLRMVAELMLGDAQAVPGISLENAVADLGVEVEGALAEGAGKLKVAKKTVVETDVVQCFRLSCLVTDSPVELHGLLGVVERVGVMSPPEAKEAETAMDLGLAQAVAQLPVQTETVRVVDGDLIVITERTAGIGQEAAGYCLGRGVTEACRGGERGPLRGGVQVVPSYRQKGRHGPGDLPGMGIPPGSGGKGDGDQQHLTLSVEPG